MKTTVNTPPPATTDFPGVVIDPNSGRKCALQVDIFRSLKLSGSQVQACNARCYQDRYYDIEDVINARRRIDEAKDARNARRNRGFIMTELAGIFAATIAGTAIAAAILATTGKETGATLRTAVEELGFSGAAEARRQWETLAGIASLETLNTEEK